jgi:hypothetical protein
LILPQKRVKQGGGTETSKIHQNIASLSLEERLPIEVWNIIFSYLYPSQLARLALVSWSFCDLVAGAKVWRRDHYKFKVHKYDSRIYEYLVTPPREEPRVFMRYLCASSFLFCEGCLEYMTGVVPGGPMKEYPLSVQMTIKSENGNEDEERSWSVRLCLGCRVSYYRSHPEPVPIDLVDKTLTRLQLREMYYFGKNRCRLVRRIISEVTGTPVLKYSAVYALKMAREMYGGDVGIRSIHDTYEEPLAKMKSRYNALCLEDHLLVIPSGSSQLRCHRCKINSV